MKNNEIDPKEAIIKCALEEFSKHGLKGSRSETITKKAKVNKAMLFYYFGSKQNLYEIIIKRAVTVLLDMINDLISPTLSVEEFLENFPTLYINFFSKNKNFIKMLALDLIQNPEYIAGLISTMFREKFGPGPAPLETIINKWFKEDKITEKDPVHFMLNIMSLIIFPFIIKPIPEAIFDKKIEETTEYFDYRKKSIQNLLKRGLLK